MTVCAVRIAQTFRYLRRNNSFGGQGTSGNARVCTVQVAHALQSQTPQYRRNCGFNGTNNYSTVCINLQILGQTYVWETTLLTVSIVIAKEAPVCYFKKSIQILIHGFSSLNRLKCVRYSIEKSSMLRRSWDELTA